MIGIYYFAIVNLSFSLVTSFQFAIFTCFTFKVSSGKIALLFMKRTIHKKGTTMHDENFISILSDTTIKYLLKKKETRKIFFDMIKYLTNIDLTNYSIVDAELNSGNKIKDYRLDLLLNNGDILVNIEVNNQYNKWTSTKSLVYLFRLAGSRLESGSDYRTKEVIQLNFNNTFFTKDKEAAVLIYQIYNEKYQIIKNGIKIYDIFLEKYKGICYTGNNKEEMLLSMLTASNDEELKRIVNGNKEGVFIMNELEQLKANDEFNAYYNIEKVQKMSEQTAYLDGIDKGIEKGVEKSMSNVARVMLKAKESIDKISLYTGLSTKEIEKLI